MSSPAMYIARFGGIAFDCISTSDSINRDVVEQSQPRKSGATLQNMGAGARRTRLRCIFFEVAPEGDDSDLNYLERYEAFYAKVNSGETHSFVHPIFGSYRAQVVGDISTDATSDEFDSLMLECTFVEDSDDALGSDPAVAQLMDTGIAGVSIQSAKLNSSLSDAGLSSDVPDDVLSKVSAWSSSTSRKVNLELQSLTNKISGMIDEYELATNLSRQPIWRSAQRLQGEVRKAASLFQKQQPQIFSFTVVSDVPLRVLVAEMYGAKESSSRYAEMVRLNDISDPMLIRAGTTLKATSPNTAKSRGLRSAL